MNLLRAIAEIGRIAATRVTALSSFYDTQPIGMVNQDNFLNATLGMETCLSPHQLLYELQRIETVVFKRIRTVHWGPRPMDLDILFFGDLVLTEEELTIPHPRLHERGFVLVPLADIAPDFIHPVLQKSVTELLVSLNTNERVEKFS